MCRCKNAAVKPVVYTMTCPEGEYRAHSWLGLGWAILTHRVWHLWHDHKWMD